MDTFDPKPDSGSEYTGPLSKPITTNIDGIIIGELLPLLTAEKESVELTLKAPASPSRAPITLRLSGRAQIDGREVVRKVVPADDMMQAFIYRHLVPAEDLEVAVLERAGNNRATPKRPNTDRKKPAVKIPPSSKAESSEEPSVAIACPGCSSFIESGLAIRALTKLDFKMRTLFAKLFEWIPSAFGPAGAGGGLGMTGRVLLECVSLPDVSVEVRSCQEDLGRYSF